MPAVESPPTNCLPDCAQLSTPRFAVIGRVTPAQLSEPLKIQGYDVNVLQAIYHVVEHFSGHTGQIIFATKFLTGEDMGFYRHLRVVPAAYGENSVAFKRETLSRHSPSRSNVSCPRAVV
jgi:hypothetical protein